MNVYIPSTDTELEEMRQAAGIVSAEAMFAVIPSELRLTELPKMPPALTELELVKELKALAAQNTVAAERPCFLGCGAYDHYIPTAVHHISSRQEFYTSYTPYQPELSQGTLQAIFEFQSYITRLTGLDIANSSMYDGASAAAEAALMAVRATDNTLIYMSDAVPPQYQLTIRTYVEAQGFEVRNLPIAADGTTVIDVSTDLDEAAAILVASPNYYGIVEDMEALAERAHADDALMVAVCDPLAMAILKPPGLCSVDIAVGETQPFGMSLSFGGPYAGYLATTEKLLRRMPGRIVGETVDRDGRRTFVLTMQAREQHIRREKATSNICTNQALCATIATIHLSLMGQKGIVTAATLTAQNACLLSELLQAKGLGSLLYDGPFFREFAFRLNLPDQDVARLNRWLDTKGVTGGYDLSRDNPELAGVCLFAVTEKRTRAEIEQLVDLIAAYSQSGGDI